MSALATEQARFRDSVPLPKLAERSPFSFRSGSVTSVFIVIVSLAALECAVCQQHLGCPDPAEVAPAGAGAASTIMAAGQAAEPTAAAAAQISGVYPQKGYIGQGSDADICVLNPNAVKKFCGSGQFM